MSDPVDLDAIEAQTADGPWTVCTLLCGDVRAMVARVRELESAHARFIDATVPCPPCKGVENFNYDCALCGGSGIVAPAVAAAVMHTDGQWMENERHNALTLTVEAHAAEREHCAKVCENQAKILDAGRDRDGAGGARLCAVVLRALTPSAQGANDVIVGRDRSPTLDDVRAHEEQHGSGWWVHESGGLWYMQVLNSVIYAAGPRRATEPPTQGRWWCWNKGPIAWPVTP